MRLVSIDAAAAAGSAAQVALEPGVALVNTSANNARAQARPMFETLAEPQYTVTHRARGYFTAGGEFNTADPGSPAGFSNSSARFAFEVVVLF